MAKLGSERIHARYQVERRAYRSEHGKDLAPANFSKAAGYVNRIIAPSTARRLKSAAKMLVKRW